MFIGTEQNTIQQFFKDIGFIAPQGMTLDYFILPQGSDVASVAPSQAYPTENVRQDPKRGTTLVYQPKDLTKLYSNPKTVQQETVPQPMPYTPVAPEGNPIDGMPKQVMSQEVKNRVAVLESSKAHVDVRLLEQVGSFPKGTHFHFKADRTQKVEESATPSGAIAEIRMKAVAKLRGAMADGMDLPNGKRYVPSVQDEAKFLRSYLYYKDGAENRDGAKSLERIMGVGKIVEYFADYVYQKMERDSADMRN
jgi:hypothetical protein